MKRLAALVLVFGFVLVSATAFAMPEPIMKLKDGIKDIVTSPLEIKDHTVKEVKDSNFHVFGLVGGLLKGTAYMVKKSISGAVDVATFPIK